MSFDSSEPKQCSEWLNLVTQINPWYHWVGHIIRFRGNGFYHMLSVSWEQRNVDNETLN